MDERSERVCDEQDDFDRSVAPTSTGQSSTEAYDPEKDPVLKALRAAPWAQVSEEELAELEEMERNVQRWIPASEFMAFVARLREEQNVDD